MQDPIHPVGVDLDWGVGLIHMYVTVGDQPSPALLPAHSRYLPCV